MSLKLERRLHKAPCLRVGCRTQVFPPLQPVALDPPKRATRERLRVPSRQQERVAGTMLPCSTHGRTVLSSLFGRGSPTLPSPVGIDAVFASDAYASATSSASRVLANSTAAIRRTSDLIILSASGLWRYFIAAASAAS